MNKVLAKICVPATGDSFDIFVSVDVPIRELIRVMVTGVIEITNGRYISSGLELLCMKEPVGVLNPELSLEVYGIRDGTQLYLI